MKGKIIFVSDVRIDDSRTRVSNIDIKHNKIKGHFASDVKTAFDKPLKKPVRGTSIRKPYSVIK